MRSEYTPEPWLKRFLPGSLFGRAFLILVVPMLLMQTTAIYYFYAEHWEKVERHFSMSLAGDVGFLLHEIQYTKPEHLQEVEILAHDFLRIEIHKEPADPEIRHFPRATDDDVFAPFVDRLRDTIDEPFLIRRSPGENKVILRIKLPDSVVRMQFSLKRLTNITADIFIWWMIGSSLLLLTVATLFLRNQIRPIRKLAEAAENFGKGQESPDFRPQGASEVRQAGRSFIAMRERLTRMIGARTEMLAAISHDLRTPLTRMRLALAMLPDQKYVKPLLSDVQDMEKMIQEYLDFARGGSGEQPKHMKLSALLNDIVGKYVQQKKDVTLRLGADPDITVFPGAMRRCFYNIIDNALRYGQRCTLHSEATANSVEILIDDDGPGIPPEQRELAKQPFKRLDLSRNADTVGTGLGLSIVQDIVLRHGGEMSLEDSPLGGLRVRIVLPV